MPEHAIAPSLPKTDKAQLLGHFYGYLGGRIDSLSRRSSLLMVFLASYLAFASSPLLKGEIITAGAKLEYALRHPIDSAGHHRCDGLTLVRSSAGKGLGRLVQQNCVLRSEAWPVADYVHHIIIGRDLRGDDNQYAGS